MDAMRTFTVGQRQTTFVVRGVLGDGQGGLRSPKVPFLGDSRHRGIQVDPVLGGDGGRGRGVHDHRFDGLVADVNRRTPRRGR